MQKLIVCIMGQNCERFIEMSLESVKDADVIVYCDGGSKDKTLDIVNGFFNKINKGVIIKREYEQEHLGANGRQRNFYLQFLKENYKGEYCLILDADEVLEEDGIKKIKDFINNKDDIRVWDVHMRHLIGNLNYEDSMVDKHWCLHRLFKIEDDLYYEPVEHPVLRGKFEEKGFCDVTTIFHLAYISGMFDILKRYENHKLKSNIHTPQFLIQWRNAHYFNTYPRKQFNPIELPEVILKTFGINPDELYFANRGIDMKHPLMVRSWYEYFKPTSVLDLGCGRGPYLYFWNWFVNDIKGIDISQFAVENSFVPDKACVGDITDKLMFTTEWDLITCIDVLEHLDDEQLDKALKNISTVGKKFLFSIPFIGDPNLMLDNTHKQFRSKEDWVKLIESFGIKIKETPNHWLFKEQILIGEK